ncbi:MAG: TauD/TfdA family dioxygenase [Aliivibrio sp.]|uniref:TauD/TfdA dioxygenase family protein n=1 Tax=Aliivibrio sp. TaxID=1872443 RepID=UPI001A4E3702|nr:TauD/TfdA family dioxygenase [Aliivibrio sp.]
MHIEPLTPHIGAIISEVNITGCSDNEFAAIYQAWYQYKVIFFRDVHLTPQQHLSLASRFGELEPVHPFFPNVKEAPQISIIETCAGNAPLESEWHTDLTWRTQPSKASILHAQHLPDCGGDTIWCSMSAVFDSLSEEEKSALRMLSATHSLHAFKEVDSAQITQQWHKDLIAVSERNPPVVHPLVTTVPETGEEVLFINEQFTRSIKNMNDNQSAALLTKLFDIARKPEFQVRFRWQPNSLAIWDNRATQHYAVIDYSDTPRKLHRVTVT